MYENIVLQAIEATEPKPFTKIGWMISFADIYESCSISGLDNQDGVMIGVKH